MPGLGKIFLPLGFLYPQANFVNYRAVKTNSHILIPAKNHKMNILICFVKKLIILGLLIIISASVSAQFTAEMVNTHSGITIKYKIYNDGTNYRYEFEESGEQLVVIVHPEKKLTSVLLPSLKTVQHMEYQSMSSISNDPVQSIRYYRENYLEKPVGTESIHGIEARVFDIFYGSEKLLTCWMSEELNFPLKIINHQQEGVFMEVTGIQTGLQDPALFRIPDDYTEVDSRGRPIIPEPPAPESWNDIEMNVPFGNVFRRGDKIKFKISENVYHTLILDNTGETPAKVIRTAFRNGAILSSDEQGPESYRTNRLFKGESRNLTQDWDVGLEIVIEVHEGEIYVGVELEG